MPGTNAGTGQPINFRCSSCRRRRRWPQGSISSVRLTGRKKRMPIGRKGIRNSGYRREYECSDCGHTGWSRHVDLERMEARHRGK